MDTTQKFLRNISLVLITLALVVLPNLWWTQLNQNFVYPKVILLDFILVIVAGMFFTFKDIAMPENKYFYVLAGLAASKLLATIFNWNWVTVYSVIGAFGFVLLASFFQNIWKKCEFIVEDFFWPSVLSIFAIFGFVAFQFYNSRYLNQNPEPLFYSGPFGNINMMCEFLVFLLPWFMLLVKNTTGKKSIIASVATYCSLTILLVGQGRSAWMGVFLCFAYEAWKGMDRKQWLVYLAALFTYWGTQTLPSGTIDYAEAKRGSLAKRETLYFGASSMLLDHPIGIGGAAFEYSYIPYQLSTKEAPVEREKFNTPHNEFFKWSIENGWLYLLSALAFFFLFFRDIWAIKAKPDEKTFYRTSFLVFLPQITFQFPFENPASSMIMAILFGILLANLPHKTLAMPKWGKILAVVLCLGLFAKAGTQTYSKWIESQHFQDREAMATGCPVDRTNWRLCFFYSLKLLEGAPAESLKNTLTQIWQRPFDFHALRALGFYYIARNDQKNACEVTQVYDTLFKNTSYFSPFIKDNCQSVPNPVPFQNSSQFYHDYLKWMSGHM